jgi:hypothetical protein
MTRVIWDQAGTRRYHTGVDRGMLYVGEAVAVPWNGLVSVSEKRSGGDAQPVYLDGRKVQNIAAGEFFGATVQTFTFPIEFSACAGRFQLAAGLYAADQPKQEFGFSYRTLIGNDTQGTNFAYRIHVVYNAIAQIADFEHETNGDSPTAKIYSGDITTVPVAIDRFKPTSHIIVDTRNVSSDNLASIEDILYGGYLNGPMLPDISDLVALLS